MHSIFRGLIQLPRASHFHFDVGFVGRFTHGMEYQAITFRQCRRKYGEDVWRNIRDDQFCHRSIRRTSNKRFIKRSLFETIFTNFFCILIAFVSEGVSDRFYVLLIQILLLFPDIFQRLFTHYTITNERSSFFPSSRHFVIVVVVHNIIRIIFPRRDRSSRSFFPGTTAFRRRCIPVRRPPTFAQIVVLSRPFQPRNPMHVQTLLTTLHPVLKLINQVRFPALLTEQNRNADTRHERARCP